MGNEDRIAKLKAKVREGSVVSGETDESISAKFKSTFAPFFETVEQINKAVGEENSDCRVILDTDRLDLMQRKWLLSVVMYRGSDFKLIDVELKFNILTMKNHTTGEPYGDQRGSYNIDELDKAVDLLFTVIGNFYSE